jgi:UDP-N-acetylmuramoylalanine--D-glutamate ligase
MKDLNGKKILVVGLGRSGLAAVRHCVSNGARVMATDAKPLEELGVGAQELLSLGVELSLGRNDASAAERADMVIVSPGVPLDVPVIVNALSRGVPVVGEMELAARELDRPIVAVTGTNGKTTTTALIGHLLKASGIEACVAGNIGTPILSCLDAARASDVVVLEVSSFQMETTPSLKADVAVWLNATEDHVDRHGSFQAYVNSKAKLFEQMGGEGFGIYNVNDAVVAARMTSMEVNLVPFDAEGNACQHRGGSCGACDGHDLVTHTERNGEQRYPIAGARLVGVHNRENMLAAVLASELSGASPEAVRAALQTFNGLPHRMQFVAELEGVSYYDDSKGTNVGAVVRALQGFERPVVLIAGGLSKGADLSPLADKVEGKVRKAILIGEASGEMEKIFTGRTETERASSMEDAVRKSRAAAKSGDSVLLSPACASFDMFRDYAERGDAFQAAVRKLVTGCQSPVTNH